ncbi:MAG: type II toxin-antitoxin system HicA family toxin [Ignavibacteria bacterium]|nr:type II toxin-antitoxin system HicA family toxin [Ignavibacteria bacterium]
MSNKLPSLTCKEIIKILEKKGFHFSRQSGSHAIYKNSSGRRTTVPIHPGKIIGKGLLSQIMKDTDISIEDFK